MFSRFFPVLLAGVLLCGTSSQAFAELRVPAFTAYLEPNPDRDLRSWASPGQSVLWFGRFETNGTVSCKVSLRVPTNGVSKLRLSLAGQSKEVAVTGLGDEKVVASFGDFQLKEPGYQKIQLESLNSESRSAGSLDALLLDGPAATDAHFNLKSRRNAASVHLTYPVEKGTNVSAFYCELTAVEDPLYTYYMACGWHRGYFGMQVNGPTERRIIFSVWDSGNEGVSRSKVTAENRVQLLGKGEAVDAGDFGNEGTGGHSHLVFPWKTGEKQRFLVTAQPTNSTHTIYSGYFFRPDQNRWMLVSSWNAPHDGAWLHGLYSFSENFGGSNGHLRRKALFGNQWIRTEAGEWLEVTTAGFSHDPTGKTDRLDRFMGVENGQFFLSQGGFVAGFTKYGEKFNRPALGQPPVIDLTNLH